MNSCWMLTLTQTLAARCGVPGEQVVGRRGRPECARPGRHDTIAPSMHREPPQHCERAGQPRRASVGASLLPLRIPAFPSLSLRVMHSRRSFASRPKNFFYALFFSCSCRDALVDTSQSTGPRISDVCVLLDGSVHAAVLTHSSVSPLYRGSYVSPLCLCVLLCATAARQRLVDAAARRGIVWELAHLHAAAKQRRRPTGCECRGGSASGPCSRRKGVHIGSAHEC